jgi:hypothetical protein
MEKDIIKTYMELGALATFFVLVLRLLYKYFNKKICEAKDSHEVLPMLLNPTQSDLLTHDYFTKMKTHMTTRIPFLKIEGKERQACLVDFLLIKYRTFYEVITEFCKTDVATDTADRGDKWLAAITTVLLNGVAAYEKEALEVGIPAIFLTCFNKHHSVRLTECWDLTTSLARSKYFPSNARRTEVALDMLVVIFNATLIDAERTMDELNGELTEALVLYSCPETNQKKRR